MEPRVKAVVAGAVLAFVGTALAVGVYRHATREQRELDRAFGPGPKPLVAEGSLFGERWKVFAHRQGGLPCLVAHDVLFSNGQCFRPGKIAGAPIDFTVWTGMVELESGRVFRYAAVVGAAPMDVARVRISFEGHPALVLPTTEIRGFEVRFFVRVLEGTLPAGPGRIEAFDARGRPVESSVPASA